MRNYLNKKEKLYEYQKGICYGCRKVFSIDQLTIDHIFSKSKRNCNPFWIDELFNLRLLCLNCHLNHRPGGFGKLAKEKIEEDLKKKEGIGDWILDEELEKHYLFFLKGEKEWK
jgi:5-methylcytosine-specific restriction endonuclease McrA